MLSTPLPTAKSCRQRECLRNRLKPFTWALQDAIRPVDAEELAIHGDLLVLRKDHVEEMAKQKLSLIKWLIGMFIAQSGLLIGVIALCHQQP